MPHVPDARHAALTRVAEQFGLADIYVFGSRANEFVPDLAQSRSIQRIDSDVDIAVRPRAGRTLSPADRIELTLALEESLAERRVDLVILPEASPFLALAAIRGNLLFAADAVDQAEYELFVLRRAGDLAPLEWAR